MVITERMGFVEHFTNWKHISFPERLISIPLVPLVMLSTSALMFLTIFFDLLVYLTTGNLNWNITCRLEDIAIAKDNNRWQTK